MQLIMTKEKDASLFYRLTFHLASRDLNDVAATSFSSSQQHRRYISNETPNDISVERC